MAADSPIARAGGDGMRRNWFESLPQSDQDRIYSLWSEISHLSRTEQTERVHSVLKDSVALPSRASVHRKFKEFEERCEALREATQLAERMMETSGDEAGKLSEASLQMAQSLIFQMMIERGEELSPKEITLITRASADAVRGSVSIKKYQAEVRQRFEDKAKELQGGKSREKLDPETLKIVLEELVGIL